MFLEPGAHPHSHSLNIFVALFSLRRHGALELRRLDAGINLCGVDARVAEQGTHFLEIVMLLVDASAAQSAEQGARDAMAGDRDPGPRLLRGGLAGDFGQALRSSESAVKASTGRSLRQL